MQDTREVDAETKQCSQPPGASGAFFFRLRTVTPARLAFLLFLISAFSAVFCAYAVSTIHQHEFAVRTVGVDAAPSVVAAYEIKNAVLSMDTDLADELLYSPNVPECSDREKDYEQWREVACKRLVAAAENITYKGEREPIENIQLALGRYAMLSQQARDLHTAGEREESIKVYRLAFETVQNELLPNIDALEKNNSGVLESTYNQEKSASNLSRGFLLVLGLLLICSLLYVQIFLAVKFRRRLSPPLLVAILGLSLLLHHLTNSLTLNGENIKTAKENSYDSILALLKTRANASNSCANASRQLLDVSNAPEYSKIYDSSIRAIATFDAGNNIDKTVEKIKERSEKNAHISIQGMTGSLADAANNICYAGEAKFIVDVLEAFSIYTQTETKVRELVDGGSHDEAVRKCLSYNPEGSKYPFTKLDYAVTQALDINKNRMDVALKEAFRSLEGLALDSVLGSILTIVCAYLALMPRMDEYVRYKNNY